MRQSRGEGGSRVGGCGGGDEGGRWSSVGEGREEVMEVEQEIVEVVEQEEEEEVREAAVVEQEEVEEAREANEVAQEVERK